MSSEELKVHHRPSQRMFLARLAPGKYAFIEYELKENKVFITKTYTPPEFRGRGIASRLMQHVIKWARDGGYKVVPICSFAVYFFKKHPQYSDLLE